jgi:multidrug efflux system outer membrane protein
VPDQLAPGGNGGTSSSYTAGVGVTSFELDLFGRVRNLSQAALDRYAATEEAQRAAQISLVAEVATVYEAVLADDSLLALSRQTLASRTESHQRQIQLREQGASSEFDLRQSESLFEAAKIALAQTTRQRALDENALTVLVGRALPAELLPAQDARWDSNVMTELPAGLPSDLLAARPDIRRQEALLRSSNANIGVARAAFFPRITLTGAFGSSSNELSGLFSAGTGSWSFMPQISLPIFDGGRNRANLGVAKADRDIAVAQYDKTIQVAFREVADALAGRATLGEELRAVKAQESAEQVRYDLAKLRYDGGQSSYLEYLDAQRSLFGAQQQTIRTSLAELQNRIGLYKALGGGWTSAQGNG